MLLKVRFIVMLVAIMFMVVGCGGGGGSEDHSHDDPIPTPSDIIDAVIGDVNAIYKVPKGATVISKNTQISATKAAVVTAGAQEEVAGVIAKESATVTTGTTLTEKITNVTKKISTSTGYISKWQEVTSQTVGTSITSEFTVTTLSSYTSVKLTQMLITSIVGSTQVVSYPDPCTCGIKDTEFNVRITIYQFEGHYYYIITVVPVVYVETFYSSFISISSYTNIISTTTVITQRTQTFTVSGGAVNPIADFLFVIDDSGSMGDDQDAISVAAQDFADAIQNTGVNCNTAIITTSYGAEPGASCTSQCYDRVLKDVGIIKNDIALLKQKVVVGTSGSASEKGIYNAEQALTNGLLAGYSFPRAGSALSVVIISDEPSYYYNPTSSNPFNLYNNVFTQNNYKVYSIVEKGSSGYYEDLSIATGGLSGNIRNTDSSGNLDYSQVMQAIARQAGGAASQYVFEYTGVIYSTISVTVNSVSVVASVQNGWVYNAASNSLVFSGTAIPQLGQSVVVTYSSTGTASVSTAVTPAMVDGSYTGNAQFSGGATDAPGLQFTVTNGVVSGQAIYMGGNFPLNGTFDYTNNVFTASDGSLTFTGSYNTTSGQINGTFTGQPLDGTFTSTKSTTGPQNYVGTGQYDGGTGTFAVNVTIATDGTVTGTATYSDVGAVPLSGTYTSATNVFTATETGYSTTYTGSISGTVLSGTFEDTGGANPGTFTCNLQP